MQKKECGMNLSLRTPLTNVGFCQCKNTENRGHCHTSQHNRCLKIK